MTQAEAYGGPRPRSRNRRDRRSLNAPVRSLVPTDDGSGYWLMASDGGGFNYSDRPFMGSLGSRPPAHPVVAIASTFRH